VKTSLTGNATITTNTARVIDSRITGIRWQQRGTATVLQVSHAWQQGTQHGVEWVDVPTVDANGNPVTVKS
jgi:hypothetical protein